MTSTQNPKTWAEMAPGDTFTNGIFGISTVESVTPDTGITPAYPTLRVKHTLGEFIVSPASEVRS